MLSLSHKLFFSAHSLDPVWEHPGNVKGGKWVISLPSSCELAQVWETCVLHAIGEQFSMSDSVCGVVLARRGEPRGDSLCVWNNDCSRTQEIEVRERREKEEIFFYF